MRSRKITKDNHTAGIDSANEAVIVRGRQWNDLMDDITDKFPDDYTLKVSDIDEAVANSGVTVDGVILKDAHVLAADGTAAAPSFTFESTPDMGMYLTSVVELGFAAEGVFVARMSVDQGVEAAQGSFTRIIKTQGAPTNSNIDPADKDAFAEGMLAGLLTATPAGAIDYTLPTGAQMGAACGSHVGVDQSFDFSIINIGAGGIITFVAAADFTIVGAAAVAANTSATFRVRCTAADTFVLYRLS